MGFASKKIQGLDNSVSKARRNVLNQDSSQKTGKLRSITQPLASAVTNAAGTVSNVGHVVAKVAGVLGATGLQQALEGSTKVSWKNTYSKTDEYVVGDPRYSGQKTPLNKNDRSERSGRRLKDFQERISSIRDSVKVDTLNTFEMTMEFEPSVSSEGASQDSGTSVIASLMQGYHQGNEKTGVSSGNNQLCPTVDLGVFVQRMTLPNITLQNGQTVKTLLGEFPVNGIHLSPDQHVFSLEIVNLTRSIAEDIFYRWMREISAPFWVYGSQPYTTANVTIDFTEHTNLKYVFLNCRPSNIQTIQPTQEFVPNFTRQVQFTFDWMYVESLPSKASLVPYSGPKIQGLQTRAEEGILDKVSRIGNAANFSASNILKI